MKMNFLQTALALFFLTNVSAHKYTKDNVPQSLMDVLYGELINGDAERQHVADQLNSGELLPPTVDFNTISGQDFDHEELSEFHTLKHLYHTTEITLPDNDYTDDLLANAPFGGFGTFANVPSLTCFNPANLEISKNKFDVAIVGAGFDTATSYRPGARFGPRGIRLASKRMGGGSLPNRGYLNRHIDKYYRFSHKTDKYGRDPFMGTLKAYDSIKIADCGDVPMMATDNRVAMDALYRAERLVHKYPTTDTVLSNNAYLKAPRIITLGGDHAITLATVKSAYETYKEPITVLHFDSHLDTWGRKYVGGEIGSDYALLTHGSFLHAAAEKGYINKNNSMHIGIRGRLKDNTADMENDISCGFDTIFAKEVDVSGVKGIVELIKKRVYGELDFKSSAKKDTPVYITFDIDVLDPVHAPATGTSEPGGFTIREVQEILDGLEGINLIGADVVEVAPIYDNPGETTCLNAAHVVDSFLGLMTAYKVTNDAAPEVV